MYLYYVVGDVGDLDDDELIKIKIRCSLKKKNSTTTIKWPEQKCVPEESQQQFANKKQ